MCVFVCVRVCAIYVSRVELPQGLGLAAEHGSFFRWPDHAANDRYSSLFDFGLEPHSACLLLTWRRFWGALLNLGIT